MAVDPRAIQTFLEKPLALTPQFKHQHPNKLQRLIYDSTGLPFSEKTVSRAHQLEGTAFALYLRRSLLYFFMRSGKSKCALDWASHLIRSKITKRKGLVIAHAPIGAEVWRTQAERHSDLRLAIVLSGPTASDDFCNALDSDCDLVVIPHSTIQTLFTVKRYSKRKERMKLYPDMDALKMASEFFSFCIIDEIDQCSDPYNLRFALASELIQHCDQRLGLTGTPVGRNPFDLWAQVALIDDGVALGKHFGFFQAAFGEKKKIPYLRQERIVFNHKLMPILQQKLDSVSMAYTRDELPQATRLTGLVELRMKGEQKEAYNNAVDRLIKLSSGDKIQIESEFHKLRQIASGYLPYADSDGVVEIIHFPDSVKLAWLDEFLSEVPSDVQCIMFHWYQHTGALIAERIQKAKLTHTRLHGGMVSAKQRNDAVAAFQSGKAQFFVSNAQAGGVGIDLPQADYLCFFESPVSPRIRAQAEARPMARGDRPVMIDDLVCAAVERKILGFLEEGNDLAATILRGKRDFFQSLRD